MVVLTTRLCALNSYEGRPHSWAARSQLGTERSPLAGHRPSAGHRGVSIRGLRKQWSPPAGRAPSIAHAGDSTLWLLAFNWARRGPDLWYSTPGKCTDGSLLVGLVSSPTHGGDPTRGPCTLNCAHNGPHPHPRALNCARSGPHQWAVRPQFPRRASPLAGLAL